MTRIEELEAEIVSLKVAGKSVIKNEMERTAECLRLRDINADLVRALQDARNALTLGSTTKADIAAKAACGKQIDVVLAKATA